VGKLRESEPIERIFRSRFCTRTTRVRSGERPDLGDDGAGPVSGVGLAAGSVKKKEGKKRKKTIGAGSCTCARKEKEKRIDPFMY
jgi:hypothetical protein